jgi:adenylate cyclase class 2
MRVSPAESPSTAIFWNTTAVNPINGMTQSSRETEIKLALPDAKSGRALLRGAGFRVTRRRVFEGNDVLDTPECALRKAGSLLRVRRAGRVATLTYKGPAAVSRHKSREEVETRVPDAAIVAAIFERLGFKPTFRYEKYRTEYGHPDGGGVATLDETPIGVFMELEGTPRWIDRAARQLGFAECDYITSSYGRLFLEWRHRQGLDTAADMVFGPQDNPAKKR